MEHVVIGIDAEEASQKAVDWVIHRARANDEMYITLVTAFDLILANPVRDIDLLEKTRARVEAAVPSVSIEPRLVERSILNELIEQSQSADLLVIGSHPRRHLLTKLMGNLSVGIAARSECPTVIVPTDWIASGGPVVVGVADDASSDAAAIFAAREAVDAHTTLHVVHSFGPPVMMLNADGTRVSSSTDGREAHRARLDAMTVRLERAVPGVEILSHLHTGPAIEVLLSESESARLIVIGTHHRSPMLAFLLDATGRGLISSATSPICVVPPRRPERDRWPTRRRIADAPQGAGNSPG